MSRPRPAGIRVEVFFDGFTLATADCGAATLRVRHGGDGPPVVLLHGHPRTHATWHRVAARLATRHTVVCPDLRGYGRSPAPPDEPGHAQAMCEDYRAGLAVDDDHDRADLAAGRRLACPMQVLWALREDEGLFPDPVQTARTWADDGRGQGLDCGHHVAEEAPAATADALAAFWEAVGWVAPAPRSS